MSGPRQFNERTKQWEQHCQATRLSSDLRDFLNHPTYHAVVELGDEIIPWVIDRYRQDDFLPWGFVLEDVTGIGMIADRNRFNPREVKQQWLSWWDEQASCQESTKSSGNV